MERDGRYTLDGDELRRQRLARGWTLRELALYASTSHDALIALEYNRRRPRKALLGKIAKALELEPRALLQDRGDDGRG